MSHCEIIIATSVRDEVVIAGNRYPDAQAARQRIDKGQIRTIQTRYPVAFVEHTLLLLQR